MSTASVPKDRTELLEWLAAKIDPKAFDPEQPRSKAQVAVIQWAARQHMAREAATAALAAFDELIVARKLVCRTCQGYGVIVTGEPARGIPCSDCALP